MPDARAKLDYPVSAALHRAGRAAAWWRTEEVSSSVQGRCPYKKGPGRVGREVWVGEHRARRRS